MMSRSPLGNSSTIPNSYCAVSDSRTLATGISRGSENAKVTLSSGMVNFQESPLISRFSGLKSVTVPTASKNKEEAHRRTFNGGASTFQRSKNKRASSGDAIILTQPTTDFDFLMSQRVEHGTHLP